MKYLLFWGIIFVLFSYFSAQFIGLFEIPDSYFYYVLGRYLITGELNSVGPFNEIENPSTLFAPVYSIIAHTFIIIPQGPQFYLPFLHLLMIGISSILIFFSLQKYLSTYKSTLASILFLLLPFNILYAFVFMSEITTMFFVSICLFIFIKINHSLLKVTLILFLSSILTLTRFAFIPWVLFSFIWFCSTIYTSLPTMKRKPQELLLLIPGIIGCLLLFWWIMFHVQFYGQPMLSTYTGRHLYNNVVAAGKFVPKDRSHPKIAEFFDYVPEISDSTPPWWDIQVYFAAPYYKGLLTELEVDRLYLAVSLQAIKENIIPYILHIIKLTVITPNTPPYYDNVVSQLGVKDECIICGLKACRFMWIPGFCQPMQSNKLVNDIFILLVTLNRKAYPVITTILLLLAILGTIKIILKKNSQLLVIAGIFYIQHFFQSTSEWVEGRFLIPLYPLYTLLIIFGICMILDIFTFVKKNINNTKIVTNSKEIV